MLLPMLLRLVLFGAIANGAASMAPRAALVGLAGEMHRSIVSDNSVVQLAEADVAEMDVAILAKHFTPGQNAKKRLSQLKKIEARINRETSELFVGEKHALEAAAHVTTDAAAFTAKYKGPKSQKASSLLTDSAVRAVDAQKKAHQMTVDLKRNEQQLAKDVNRFMTTEVPAELVSKMPAEHQQDYKALRQVKWSKLNAQRRAKVIEASYEHISTMESAAAKQEKRVEANAKQEIRAHPYKSTPIAASAGWKARMKKLYDTEFSKKR